MKKTLAIDCSKLNTRFPTGTHRFLVGFLNELVKKDDYEYYFYVNNIDEKFLIQHNFFSKGKVINLQYPYFYTQLGLLLEIDKYDYFLFPWQTMPFLGIFSKSQKISIIHDTGFSYISKITTFLTQFISNQIFSVSESTAKKLFRKSYIIGEGVDQKLFYPVNASELKIYSKNFEIPDFFILSLGRIEPRKNVENNIKAYAKVKKYYPNLKYIFIGNFENNEEKIYSLVSELGLSREEIVFKNYVSDFELNIYLNKMEFLVFTSFDEGFGLPVLEAYSVQKPVLLSNIQQLADFKLSANQLADPFSVDAISEKMIKFLKRQHGIDSKKAYKEVLSRFSWKKTLEIFVNNLK